MTADQLCPCEEERAAILEYDAGMNREEAEAKSAQDVNARCPNCPHWEDET